MVLGRQIYFAQIGQQKAQIQSGVQLRKLHQNTNERTIFQGARVFFAQLLWDEVFLRSFLTDETLSFALLM